MYVQKIFNKFKFTNVTGEKNNWAGSKCIAVQGGRLGGVRT